jgi:hypothetical protein
MLQRHPNELLGNILHADPPPTQHANQWAMGQWHQPLIQTSRHNMNPSTHSVTQSHTAWHTDRTPQMVSPIKSFFLLFSILNSYTSLFLKQNIFDHRRMLPQYCINHDDVVLLMISTRKCNFSQAQWKTPWWWS